MVKYSFELKLKSFKSNGVVSKRVVLILLDGKGVCGEEYRDITITYRPV